MQENVICVWLEKSQKQFNQNEKIKKIRKIMKIYSISDLHLSINNPKPMNIFGPVWDNYIDEIIADWREKITGKDIVLIAGDISWAMKLEDAKPDIELISKLP